MVENKEDRGEIIVSWQEYIEKINKLVMLVKKHSPPPTSVIGIATGGLIPALLVSKSINKPLAVLSARSYHPQEGKVGEVKREVVFSRHLSMLTRDIRGNILLVDDLTDSGDTLSLAKEWLSKRYNRKILTISTAVIWHKETSFFQPNIYVEYVPKDEEGNCPWIVQPFMPR